MEIYVNIFFPKADNWVSHLWCLAVAGRTSVESNPDLVLELEAKTGPEGNVNSESIESTVEVYLKLLEVRDDEIQLGFKLRQLF